MNETKEPGRKYSVIRMDGMDGANGMDGMNRMDGMNGVNLETVIKKQNIKKIQVFATILIVITIVFVVMRFFAIPMLLWQDWFYVVILIIYLPCIFHLIKALLWDTKKYNNLLIKQLRKYGSESTMTLEADIQRNALVKYCSPAYDISVFISPSWFILTAVGPVLVVRKTAEITAISKTYQQQSRYGNSQDDGYFTFDVVFSDGGKYSISCLWQYIDEIIKQVERYFPNIKCEKDAINRPSHRNGT